MRKGFISEEYLTAIFGQIEFIVISWKSLVMKLKVVENEMFYTTTHYSKLLKTTLAIAGTGS